MRLYCAFRTSCGRLYYYVYTHVRNYFGPSPLPKNVICRITYNLEPLICIPKRPARSVLRSVTAKKHRGLCDTRCSTPWKIPIVYSTYYTYTERPHFFCHNRRTRQFGLNGGQTRGRPIRVECVSLAYIFIYSYKEGRQSS